MSIFNRRNAVVGWLTWIVAKRVLKKKAKDVVPGTVEGSKRPNKGAIATGSRPSAACSGSGGARARTTSRRRPPGTDAVVSLFRAALDGLVPYEPGKPEDEVQRELGLDRVVKLASNEGPWGPFPAALEAMERSAGVLNRYPDGGAFHLRRALAERHDVDPANVVTGAGADALIGHLSLATLDPGDEIVTAWPSFVSYVLDTLKLGAVPRKVPLVDDHYDLDATARCDRPAHEARVHRDAEQPDRDDDDPGAARRLLRARSRARAHGARPGVLRVHRASGLSRTGSPSTRRPAGACSSCARSRRSTVSPGCAWATASGRRT